MRERPRPEAPQPPKFCFCIRWRGRRTAVGVAVLLAAAGALGCSGVSAYRRKSARGDAGQELGLKVKGGEGNHHGSNHRGRSGTLPQCYSSPEADPSEGEWRRCADGVNDSPADMVDWSFPVAQFGFLGKCQNVWNGEDLSGGKEPRPYWAWEPSGCSLDAVNADKFCKVMDGRKGLLLVGDSLTRLSTTTLASILRATSITADSFKDEWEACGGKLKLQFVRNDVLDPRTKPSYRSPMCEKPGAGPTMDNTRCRIFARDETLSEFDTLVVNSGAHPRPANEFGREMVTAAEALTSSMKRLHGNKAVLVVRNTVPGHWDCTERMFDGPVNATDAQALVARAPDSYQWKTFRDRNAQLQKAFSPERGWKLLNAYSPTLLRPDSHIGEKDCLHYCVPGPADHWLTLLYNILLVATDSASG